MLSDAPAGLARRGARPGEAPHGRSSRRLARPAPLVHYYRAWMSHHAGRLPGGTPPSRGGRAGPPDYCFPARLEEIAHPAPRDRGESLGTRAPPSISATCSTTAGATPRRSAFGKVPRSWTGATPSPGATWASATSMSWATRHAPRRAYGRAFSAQPADARLLYERDQLWKRLGVAPARRLRELRRHPGLVRSRDDLSVELCALYNQTGTPQRALSGSCIPQVPTMGGRRGTGSAPARARTHRPRPGRRCGGARRTRPPAISARRSAAPENIGRGQPPPREPERRPLLAGPGAPWRPVTLRARARTGSKAAGFRGDFQGMSVRAFSEMTYFTALALRSLGRRAEAKRRLRGLLRYSRATRKDPGRYRLFCHLAADDAPVRGRPGGAPEDHRPVSLAAQAQLGLGRRRPAGTAPRGAAPRPEPRASPRDQPA